MIESIEIKQQTHRKKILNHFLGRKEQLILLSLVIALCNLCFIINDFIQLGNLQKPENSSQKWTLGPLISNTLGFYLATLGLVYSMVKQSAKWKYLGILALVFNLFVFILRFVFEVKYLEYRRETFGPE